MSIPKNIIVTGFLTVILAGGVLVGDSSAANTQPGSSSDPLVSKSYVDERINQVLTGMNNGQPVSSSQTSANTSEIVAQVVAQLEFLYGDKLDDGNNLTLPPTMADDVSQKFIPVSVDKGQIVLGGEGTEIILRSGSATGYCPGQNGIVDITDGRDIGNGVAIKVDHLLIVPRYDGRGVRVAENAWFMIRGDYQIEN